MKIRKGFVSNSSSSSFILFNKKIEENEKDKTLKEFLINNLFNEYDEEDIEEEYEYIMNEYGDKIKEKFNEGYKPEIIDIEINCEEVFMQLFGEDQYISIAN